MLIVKLRGKKSFVNNISPAISFRKNTLQHLEQIRFKNNHITLYIKILTIR